LFTSKNIYEIEESKLTENKIYKDKELISLLKKYKIIKENINNDLIVKFVGLVTYKDYIIYFLPKIYDKVVDSELSLKVKLILDILKKYASKKVNFVDGEYLNLYEDRYPVSNLALANFIIDDYIEYNYWQDEIHKENIGQTNIDWQLTVGKLYPIISDESPIYTNFISVNNKYNEESKLYKIYMRTLNICFKNYADILQQSSYSLDESDFDLDIVEICEILLNKINSTYKDRELAIFKAIYSMWVKRLRGETENFSLYGTTSFNLIWQKGCEYFFEDMKSQLDFKFSKPIWIDNNFRKCEGYSVNPDIITVIERNLILLDAKYYNISFKDIDGSISVSNNPGVEDIIKQYIYQIELDKENKYTDYKKYNIFLFPTNFNEKNKMYSIFGGVTIDYFDYKPIINVYMSLENIFYYYLKNIPSDKKMILNLLSDIDEFYLIKSYLL